MYQYSGSDHREWLMGSVYRTLGSANETVKKEKKSTLVLQLLSPLQLNKPVQCDEENIIYFDNSYCFLLWLLHFNYIVLP